MTLDELDVYRLAMAIGERAWAEVVRWDFFAKDTVGKQLVRAADSIAANLSEGFGRFHFKENKQFGHYGRGSLFETKTLLMKAAKRNVISREAFAAFEGDLDQLGRMLNAYIKSIGTATASLREDSPPYGDSHDPFSNDAPQAPLTIDH